MDVMDGQLWIRIAIYAAMALACSTILAFLQPAISQLLSRLFAVTYQPMHAVQNQGSKALKKGLAWSGGQLRSEEGGNAWWRVLGAVMGAAFFLLCFTSDLAIVMMTLEAYGLGSTQLDLPGEPIQIIGAALLLGGAVWGVLLTDMLHISCFWPWTEKIKGIYRRIGIGIAAFMLIMLLSVVACMAVWRSGSLTEAMDANQQLSVQVPDGGQLTLGADTAVPDLEVPKREIELKANAEETDGDVWMIYYPNVCIAVSSFLGTFICFNSFMAFLKYFCLASSVTACLIMAIPVAVLWVLMKIVDAVYRVFEMLLALLVVPGQAVLRLMSFRRDPQRPAAQTQQMPEQDQVENSGQDKQVSASAKRDGQELNSSSEHANGGEKEAKINPVVSNSNGESTIAIPTAHSNQKEPENAEDLDDEKHHPHAVNYDPFRV